VFLFQGRCIRVHVLQGAGFGTGFGCFGFWCMLVLRLHKVNSRHLIANAYLGRTLEKVLDGCTQLAL
jgi:hypothetical protein